MEAIKNNRFVDIMLSLAVRPDPDKIIAAIRDTPQIDSLMGFANHFSRIAECGSLTVLDSLETQIGRDALNDARTLLDKPKYDMSGWGPPKWDASHGVLPKNLAT